MASEVNFYTMAIGSVIDLRKIEEVENELNGTYKFTMTSGHAETMSTSETTRSAFIALWKSAD